MPPVIRSEFAHRILVNGSGEESPEDPLRDLPGAHAVVAGARRTYDGGLMDRYPEMRVICRTGIGIDNIVVPDATERGVAVCNTPEGPTLSTAETAIALILAAVKHIKRVSRDFAEQPGKDYLSGYQGMEVFGRTLGLIGLGRIGSRVARLAVALGMRVVAYDPYVADERVAEMGIEREDRIESVLARSDVVSVHAPLTEETRHLMNGDRFARMRRGAFFVNVSRGGLVDEQALCAALDQGRLAGAALDVFEPEPPSTDNPLLHRDDVIVTPHIAGVSVASRERMWRMAVTMALQVWNGEKPDHIVNPEVVPGNG
ncbi:MAG: hydroxyacid dehydrogenase [Gemmatimonadetes bacterium]|nr:hydroxyacid dehydrogenase [Gemmatimonadota bacterium]